ncbi:MAG TPA: hypothetical protein VFA47_02900 [Candidatus Manganitrophaceae bacterium]|nr:hypothetical protein [Candidatus Manganitrophaceae bacterium]
MAPFPNSLSTRTSPRNKWISSLTIASPSPTPPNSRVALASTW